MESIEVFENEIEMHIQDFCSIENIEDMSKETQNKWNACLMYIYKHMFKGTDRLKYNPNLYNKYNIELLLEILDIYIYWSYKFSKEVSISGFCKLTGIEYETMMEWSRLNAKSSEIYKKLMQENESSNSDLLASGKNPVGIMARLNHVHNWNMPGVRETAKANTSVQALPDFSGTAAPELCDNGTQFGSESE